MNNQHPYNFIVFLSGSVTKVEMRGKVKNAAGTYDNPDHVSMSILTKENGWVSCLGHMDNATKFKVGDYVNVEGLLTVSTGEKKYLNVQVGKIWKINVQTEKDKIWDCRPPQNVNIPDWLRKEEDHVDQINEGNMKLI
jgi:hypothetical protein